MTAEGADSSDEEGGSTAKKMKTAQPVVPESVAAANISSMGAVPMSTSMLTSPFMGMNPMTHYLGHLPLPMMGAMPLAGGAVSSSSSQIPSKPLFPSSGSSPSSSTSTKPAFAAYR